MASKTGNDVIGQLFETATDLQDEKSDLQQRIAANRSALRTMRDAGVLTDEQYDTVDAIYPPRKSKDEDDIAPAE